MNSETFLDFQNRVTALEEEHKEITKIITAFKIDKQLFIKAEKPIKPGIASKVAFNAYGLITGVDELTQSDIPQLSIDKIDGLRTMIEDKVSSTEVQKINENIKNILLKGDPVCSGCKVNVDKKGLVTSVSDLTEYDIPILPISKINGLKEELDLIKSSLTTEGKSAHEAIVTAGTACKVRFNKYGHVTGFDTLGIDDIPQELISRINVMESIVASMATAKSVSEMNKSVNSKLSANAPIVPGTFTKVTVDSKGLITRGEKLSISDLPELNIQDITGLQIAINSKAGRDDVAELNSSISTIMDSISKIGDIQRVKRDLEYKADEKFVKELSRKLQDLQELVNKLITSIPGDMILMQLNQITEELSNLDGRISVLENKLGIN